MGPSSSDERIAGIGEYKSFLRQNEAMRDFVYSLRELRRAPGFALAAILSLALGIGLNAALFTLTSALFLKPLPVADPQRLAQIGTLDTLTRVTGPGNPRTPVSLANLRDLRAQAQSFASIAADVGFSVTLTGAGDAPPQSLTANLVTSNYFDVLGVRPALGRLLVDVDDARIGAHSQCVLSHALWTTLFHADPAIIGAKIQLNSVPYTVTGIAPPRFKGATNVGSPSLLWLPLTQYRDVLQGLVAELFETRRFRLFNLTGRLRPGVTLAQANAEVMAIGARHASIPSITRAARSPRSRFPAQCSASRPTGSGWPAPPLLAPRHSCSSSPA